MIYSHIGIQLSIITDFLEELGGFLLSVLPQVFISGIAIILGYVFITVSRRTIENRMKNQKLGEHLSYTLITLIRWSTILLVLSLILFQFGLNIAAITGFISIIGGTVLGFAAVNTLGNAIAGFIIMISRPFRVGDRILYNERFFDVITINLIYTKLRTLDLVYVSVPNQELLKNELDNYGKKNILRQSVKVTAGYNESREKVESTLIEAVNKVPLVLKAPLPYVSITDFQNYAMEYTLYYFIREVKKMPWIEADVRKNIVDSFNENGLDLTTPLLSAKPTPFEARDTKQVKESLFDEAGSINSYNVNMIQGVGSVFSERLNSVYIYSIGDLLEAGKTREGRVDLADKTGISYNQILRWVNLADLYRIEGIGKEYSYLLESVGVDTVVELSRRNPSNLFNRILLENDENDFVKTVPSKEMVTKWVMEAKKLPRKISY